MRLRSFSSARGFTIVELLIALAIIAIILAAAIPMLMTMRTGAAETVVMREVHTVHQAQMLYLSQFGEFATTLAQLGPPRNGTAGPHASKLIPASLATGEKNGYLFTLTRTPSGFAVNARPKEFGRHGRRTFYLDEDGVLHQNWGPEPATPESPEVK